MLMICNSDVVSSVDKKQIYIAAKVKIYSFKLKNLKYIFV